MDNSKPMQLRWLVNGGSTGPERILQYRYMVQVTDYSGATVDGDYRKITIWSEWNDVQTVYGDIGL